MQGCYSNTPHPSASIITSSWQSCFYFVSIYISRIGILSDTSAMIFLIFFFSDATKLYDWESGLCGGGREGAIELKWLFHVTVVTKSMWWHSTDSSVLQRVQRGGINGLSQWWTTKRMKFKYLWGRDSRITRFLI